MVDLRPLPIDKFSRYRVSLNFFYVSLQYVYNIFISLIARMSSQLGKIQNDFIMRNDWKTVPDSYTITIEQKVQFQVGIYHEKIQLDQFKMADLRPL